MSLNSITERAPGTGPSTAKWIGSTVAALIIWGVVYSQLVPFSGWVVISTHVDPNSHLGEAISFFAYDTPKVLMLLTLVVFGMGVVRSFFSPEKTRALLAGKREGVGNVLAASLGIVTPFCSCSAVPDRMLRTHSSSQCSRCRRPMTQPETMATARPKTR